jgi:hypothetical protein
VTWDNLLAQVTSSAVTNSSDAAAGGNGRNTREKEPDGTGQCLLSRQPWTWLELRSYFSLISSQPRFFGDSSDVICSFLRSLLGELKTVADWSLVRA